jgi:hypothetical protein
MKETPNSEGALVPMIKAGSYFHEELKEYSGIKEGILLSYCIRSITNTNPKLQLHA